MVSYYIDNIISRDYNKDVMYSTKEAAKLLGLSQSHVRLLARTGKIEAKWIGRDWVILNLDYQRRRRPKGGRNETGRAG